MSTTESVTSHRDFSIVPKGNDVYVMRLNNHEIIETGQLALLGDALKGFVNSKKPGQGARTVIADLSEVGHMNSGVLGTLVGLHSKLVQHGDKPLVIAGAEPAIQEVLKITKLNKLFAEAESVDAAIASAQSGRAR
jgi:anti-anti-sigma factor